MHNVNNAQPPEKQKTNKAKVPFDNHAKPLRKNKKKPKYSGEWRWKPTFGTSA